MIPVHAILHGVTVSGVFNVLSSPTIAAVLAWVLTRFNKKLNKKLDTKLDDNLGKLSEIHVLVNGNLLKALKDVETLRQEVETLKASSGKPVV